MSGPEAPARRRRSAGPAAALLLPLLGGCAPDPDQLTVATVAGRPIRHSDLELHLRVHRTAPAEPDAAGTVEPAQIASRLLDDLIEQTALAAEAERRGIRVGPEDVEGYLQAAEQEALRALPATPAAKRRLARRRLTLEGLHRSLADAVEPVTDEEIRAWLAQRPEPAARGRRARLRTLMFATVSEAEVAYGEIVRGRISFDEAVMAYAPGPGQGSALEIDGAHLPERVREALERIHPEEITRPVTLDDGTFLFRLEGWVDPADEPDRETEERARRRLAGQRLREAYERLAREVRAGTVVSVDASRLPFRYVPEAPASAPPPPMATPGGPG